MSKEISGATDAQIQANMYRKLAESLWSLFVNRTDTYAVQNDDGTYTRISKPETDWLRKKLNLPKDLTKEILQRHLKGDVTFGVYQLHPSDANVKWLCFDIDSERTPDTSLAAKRIFDLCKVKFGKKSILVEASGTPGSKHVWVFLDPLVPASVAKYLGETILKLSNIPEVELFPKQQKAEFGNLVKLPLGIHRKAGNWSKLLNPKTMKPASVSRLKDVVPAKIDDEEVNRIKEELNKKSWKPQQGAVFSDAPYKGERMGCIKKILEGLAEHGTKDTPGRNIGAAVLSGDLLNFRKESPDLAWKDLCEWNQKNKPPLPEEELRATFASHMENRMSYGCNHEYKIAFCTGRETCPLFQKERETLEALRFLHGEPVYEKFLVNVGKTLKADVTSKKLLFLVALSAYSDNPLNLYMKGPPSTGKSWCTTKVTSYFPEEDVWSLGDMTPKALIHEKGRYNKETGRHIIELWNKIIVFLDAPNAQTLEMLKPILSHDKTEIEYKWTDPEKLKTKKVFIRGWPAMIFCTTQTKLLQEIASRGMTATPEINQAKIKAVLEFKGDKRAEPWRYHVVDEEKEMIRRAIACLRGSGATLAERPHVAIPYAKKLAEGFPSKEAQYMREFDKYTGLIAMHALLHQYQRFIREEMVDGKPVDYVIADERDYAEGACLYSAIREATIAGVPNHVIEFFKKIVSQFEKGASYDDIRKKYFDAYHKSLGKSTLRSYLDPLQDLGWVSVATHPADRRQRIVYVEKRPDISSEFRTEDFRELFGRKELEMWLGNTYKIVQKEAGGKMEVGGSSFLMNYFISQSDGKPTPNERKKNRNASGRKSEPILGPDGGNWLERARMKEVDGHDQN